MPPLNLNDELDENEPIPGGWRDLPISNICKPGTSTTNNDSKHNPNIKKQTRKLKKKNVKLKKQMNKLNKEKEMLMEELEMWKRKCYKLEALHEQAGGVYLMKCDPQTNGNLSKLRNDSMIMVEPVILKQNKLEESWPQLMFATLVGVSVVFHLFPIGSMV